MLIVEDNKDLCNMLKLQLEDKFNIYMANDGVEGLKKVHPVSYTHLDVYKRQLFVFHISFHKSGETAVQMVFALQ